MKSLLNSQPNFRDLGGMATADGRRVKRGLLYRSGDFFSLSDEDVITLEQMGLATIIDFRASREIARRPDRQVPGVKELIHIDIHDAARDTAERYLEEKNARGLETVLIGDYVRMVDIHQADFRRFLHILAWSDHLPVVYHCAAGKDRTGMATVFLLAALGVELPVIRADYMATNIYVREYADRIIRQVTASGQQGEILRPLLEVREEYLQAALDRIDQQYHGLTRYTRTELSADIEQLQQKYLEQ